MEPPLTSSRQSGPPSQSRDDTTENGNIGQDARSGRRTRTMGPRGSRPRADSERTVMQGPCCNRYRCADGEGRWSHPQPGWAVCCFLLTWLIISPSHSSRFPAGALRNSKKGGRAEGKQNEKTRRRTPCQCPPNTITNNINTRNNKYHHHSAHLTNPQKARHHPLLQQSCLTQDQKHHWLARTNHKTSPQKTSRPPNHTKPPKRKMPPSSLANATPLPGPPSAERLPALSQTRKK